MAPQTAALVSDQITAAMIAAGAKVVDEILWRIDPFERPLGEYVYQELAEAAFIAMAKARYGS